MERRSFCDPGLVVDQVVERVGRGGRIDVISLSGSGEPSLSADLGEIIREVKRKTTIPVVLITNGSLLHRDDVRREAGLADMVLPSLDAPDEAAFQRINRPHQDLSLALVVEGLRAFRQEYRGVIWLEVMLVKNMNDDAEHLEMFRQLIENGGMDKVQLNTVTRPPIERDAQALTHEELLSAMPFFGPRCEVIASFRKRASGQEQERLTESVLSVISRRSLSLDDIVRTTGIPAQEARGELAALVNEGRARLVMFGDQWFYTASEKEGSP